MRMAEPPTPIPPVAFWLGTGGLIPFVVLTGGLYAAGEGVGTMLLFWLTAYGAVILSFVGALHWGIALVHPAMNANDRALFMAWSVVPALAAWAAMLMRPGTGVLLMAATYIVHYLADQQLAQRFTLPGWYLKLRGGLTAVVVVCLVLVYPWLAHH